MPYAAGERAIKESMVRFYDAQWKSRGCGLLVDSEHIVTCVHVIASMIPGVESDQVTPPTESIRIHLRTTFSGDIHAKVIVWKPAMKEPPVDQVEDIAVLKLEGSVPDDAVPHAFVLASDWAGRTYMVHGIPESNPRGDWADGKFKGETLGGWVQLLSDNGEDLQIDHGFSGAGVWDEQLRGFAGILVANKKRGGHQKPVSYMIPATILKRAWSELPVFQTEEDIVGNHQRNSISARDRHHAQAENLSPEFIDVVLRAINRANDGRMSTKASTAEFLDTVASDARLLADLWVELLGLIRQGVSTTELPDDYEDKLREASYNQIGLFGELRIFYGYIHQILGEDDRKDLNADFMLSLARVTEYRNMARAVLDAGLATFRSMGWDGTFQSITTIEEAVATMKREAGHLTGLAKVYRATM